MITLVTNLRSWFFSRGDPRTAAALRIAFCGIYLFMIWDFHPVMHTLFDAGGLFGPPALDASGSFSLGGFYRLAHGALLDKWYYASVLVTVLALVGYRTRWTLALTYGSLILFQTRGNFVIFGADLVLRSCGLWLLFLRTDAVWAVDRLRSGNAASAIPDWPVKAVQIQCALIYLITFLCKIGTRPWQDGSAVYYALQVGDVMFGQAFALLKPYHGVFPLLTYGSLVFEGAFPFLVFYRPTRNLALLSGVGFHMGIDVMMSIRFFALTMYLGYASFLTGADWDWLATFAKKAVTRSSAAFRYAS